jgi:PAS domain S-box-containing protein
MTNNQPLSGYEYLRAQDALNAHVVVSISDIDGNITYVNDKFCQISGYERDELIGQNHRIIKSDQHPPQFYKELWQTISSGEIWTGEVCNRKKTGDYYWMKSTIVPYLDEHGRPYKYVAYRTDITTIKLQEKTHLDLLNTMGEGVFGLDVDGNYSFINRSALNMLGYKKEELIGQCWQNNIHCYAEDGTPTEESECIIFKAVHEQAAYSCDSWFQNKIGQGFNISLTATPRYEHGKFIGVLVCFHDISQRKKTESELKISAERFRRSQIAADIGSWDWDIKTGELFWSDRIAPLFGYEEGETETSYDNFLKVIHPDDKTMVQEAIRAAIEREEPYEIEHRVIWPDGSVHWLLELGSVYHDVDGNAEKMLGTVMNIHNRKVSELKLKDSQERLSIAIEGAGDGVWDWDLTTNVVRFSELYAQMLGYTLEEMPPELGTWIHSVHPEDWPRVQTSLQYYLENKVPRYETEFRLRCKDGSWKWVLSRGKVVSYDSENNPTRMTGIQTDIDARKRMESELVEAKVAAESASIAKSEFLSSMSHELRTPLNAVIGFSQVLEEDTESPLTEDQRDSLKYISQGGHHLLVLIDDVLELAKIETGKISVVEERVVFSQVMEQCLPILHNLAAGKNVDITVRDMSHVIFNADYTRVKQVVINLCTNAIKYNEKGGQVTIDCISTKDGGVRINISDTGLGVAADKQEKLFTAFNRLGQENSGIQGTGVGLIITKKLIDTMKGEIGYTSVEGLGSTFWFELPLYEEKTNKVAERFTESSSLDHTVVWDKNSEIGTRKNILYIEDNIANTRLMQAFFAREPLLNLLVEESAEKGIKSIAQQRPDLVLMDINLPGMSGSDAAEYLKKENAYNKIPIIALSAIAMKHDIEKLEGLFDAYITKPVDFPSLMDEVNKQLGRTR